MLNSPVLDTAIGLVFIFLLYSLLATSINEAISTLFGLRARMLRKGIIEGMLSNTSQQSAWQSWLQGIADFFKEVWRMIMGRDYNYGNGLGAEVYKHPIIKNYGSKRRFSVPSYISSSNFSTVLIEALKDYSEKLQPALAAANNLTADAFNNLPTITKIQYLVTYLLSLTPAQLQQVFAQNNIKVDKDTLEILQLHLRKSYQNLDDFTKRVEGWYDDSMNRVSGWYKRQVQFILFFIGIVIGLIFNVDTLDIASKLSTDKDARDKLVQMAITASQEYKNDPRVKNLAVKLDSTTSSTIKDTTQKTLDSIKAGYKKFEAEAKKMIEGDISDANNLLALGWKGFGFEDTAYLQSMVTMVAPGKLLSLRLKVSSYNILGEYRKATLKNKDSIPLLKNEYAKAYKKHKRTLQAWYVYEHITPRKVLSFLILSFAVCIGAPFWFDLLQKLIRLRSTGKKEGGDSSSTDKTTTAPPATQVTITNNSNTGEAVG